MLTHEFLDQALQAVCPIIGTVNKGGVFSIQFAPEATAQQQSAAQAILDSWDWSETAETVRRNLRDRETAKSIINTKTTSDAKALRALCSILLDEVNILRQWDTALKAAVAAATNLTDLKIRVAALSATPNRTLAQAKTAFANCIDDGSVD